MNRFRRLALLGPVSLCVVLTTINAAPPTGTSDSDVLGNLYRLYTQALKIDKSGVVAVPSRFKWSVETSWRGIDVQGNDLPDSRVMLRLYDPAHNWTALTAQMDLATASRLHHELGEVIVKKLQDPEYQHRPKLYDPKDIPTGRIVGVDKNGVAIIEFESASTPPQEVPAPR